MKNSIEVSVIIDADLNKVWDAWIKEENVMQWNVPFEDWHCPYVFNDVRKDGRFDFRMEKLDGSDGFDYKGRYSDVIPFSKIKILQDDGRKTVITFEKVNGKVKLTECFNPEAKTALDLQIEFCQSVLEKFKGFVEGLE